MNKTNPQQGQQGNYYEFPIQQQQQQSQHPLPITHHNGGPRNSQQQQYVSPQRRFLSEGELVRQGGGNELSFSKTNNSTVDNIRELAGSPQRGIYMWKDTSPGYSSNNQSQQQPPQFSNNQMNIRPPGQLQTQQSNEYNPQYDIHHHRSNPTSPTQQQIQQYGGVSGVGNRYPPQNNNNSTPSVGVVAGGGTSGYHPALRGGIPVFPPQPSPQIKRKATPTRPMSFVRALEMTEMTQQGVNSNNCGIINVGGIDQQQQQGQLRNGQQQYGASTSGTVVGGVNGVVGGQNQRSTTPTPDRTSVYDMNYEISV